MARLSINTKFRLAILLVAVLVMLFLLLSSFKAYNVEPPTKYSLYVSLFDVNAAKQVRQDIYKYTYDKGVKVSEEKVMSVDGRKEGPMGDLVRTDIGETRIYSNRYVVTGSGNIIDLKTKSVLCSEKQTLISAGKDSIVFYVNDAFRGKFYTVLKVNEGSFAKVESALFNPKAGQDVGVDYDLQNRRIWLYPKKGDKKLLVDDAGFGEEILGSKSTSVIPVYWIDSWNFVFPYYPLTKNKASILQVDARTGEKTKLGDINEMPKGTDPAIFTRDPDDNLLYVCPAGNILVDVKHKTVKPQEFYHCGNRFDVQTVPGPKGRIIKFKGDEIGTTHCALESVRDCKSAIAVEKKMKIGDEEYAQGIGVWNVHTKKWSTIMVDNIASIIGWVEEQ